MKRSDLDPRRLPPKMQRIIIGILVCAIVFCFAANMGSTLLELLFIDLPIHLGIAAVLCLLLMLGNNLLSKASNRRTAPKLAEYALREGFCQEMVDSLNSQMPEPSDRDKVLAAFILVMCGKSGEAAEQFTKISTNTLSQREFAMLMTAKILLHFQNGEFAKVIKIFETHQAMLDAAYESQPHLEGQFCAYADDALEYFMLAAVYCELMQQPEQAGIYREKAIRQLSNRSAEEAAAYTALIERQRLYAAADSSAEAQTAALLERISELKAPVSAGAKLNLRRAANRAKLFLPARLGVQPSMCRERRLPKL